MARTVGEEWDKRFRELGNSYRPTDDTLKGMPRFVKSPWILYLVEYARLKPADKVLDAGCGNAKFAVALASLGCSATALDFSTEMVGNALALKNQAEAALGELDLSVVRGDIENLAFPDNTFDLVFSSGVVEHWLNREERLRVLSEMVRITKVGGSVAAFVPNGRHPLHRWWELSRYPGYTTAPPMTRYDVKRLAEELRLSGCRAVSTDGVAPFHSISQWPDPKLLQYASIGMNKYLPQPKWLRERLGIHIFACGQK